MQLSLLFFWNKIHLQHHLVLKVTPTTSEQVFTSCILHVGGQDSSEVNACTDPAGSVTPPPPEQFSPVSLFM